MQGTANRQLKTRPIRRLLEWVPEADLDTQSRSGHEASRRDLQWADGGQCSERDADARLVLVGIEVKRRSGVADVGAEGGEEIAPQLPLERGTGASDGCARKLLRS